MPEEINENQRNQISKESMVKRIISPFQYENLGNEYEGKIINRNGTHSTRRRCNIKHIRTDVSHKIAKTAPSIYIKPQHISSPIEKADSKLEKEVEVKGWLKEVCTPTNFATQSDFEEMDACKDIYALFDEKPAFLDEDDEDEVKTKTFTDTVQDLFKAILNYQKSTNTICPKKKILSNLAKQPSEKEMLWAEDANNKKMLSFCFDSFYKIWRNNPAFLSEQQLNDIFRLSQQTIKTSNSKLLIHNIPTPSLIAFYLLITKNTISENHELDTNLSLYSSKTNSELILEEDIKEKIISYLNRKFKNTSNPEQKIVFKRNLLKNMLSAIESQTSHFEEEFRKISAQSEQKFDNFGMLESIRRDLNYLCKVESIQHNNIQILTEEVYALISKMILILSIYLGPQALIKYMEN